MSTLALREARRRVRSFADESELLPRLRETIERDDCKAVLQIAVDAYRWLLRTDEAIRQALYEGAAVEPGVPAPSGTNALLCVAAAPLATQVVRWPYSANRH